MGTNYYAKRKLEYPLAFAVNSDDELAQLKEHLENLQPTIHLGKTSAGWNFLAQWNGSRYYNDPISFINFIRDNDLVIYDEYDRQLSKEEFIDLVKTWKGKRQTEVGYKNFPEFAFLDGDWC